MSGGSPKARKSGRPGNSVKNRESGDLKPDDNPQIELNEPPTEKQEPATHNIQPPTEKQEPATHNTQPATEKMEVHHHPQLEHKPKPWKEYLLEYFMIFLAVMTGFFAESYREHISDSAKEHEFIVSMIEDARTDTANIHQCITSNIARAEHLDTLSALLDSYDEKAETDTAIYHYFRYGITHPNFVSPAERTLTQLKSSGSMRLIRNRASVDSIITYDNELKKLENQQTYYERYLNEANEFGMRMLDFRRFSIISKRINGKLVRRKVDYHGAKLLVNDKRTLTEFSNIESTYGGVVSFYVARLKETEIHAVNLIHTLQKEYNLEDE